MLFTVSDTQLIYSWKSKEMSEESIKNPRGLNNTFAPGLINCRLLPHAKFTGTCLILNSIFLHKNVVKLYTSDTLDTWYRYLNTDFTLDDDFLEL